MRALGRLARGLSAIFWGLPLALVISVQTAKGDWLQGLGFVPALAANALVLYGLILLGGFQRQERIWVAALERARIFALMNVGLSPFLYWWNQISNGPFHAYFGSMVNLLAVCGLVLLYLLNPVLWRLAAMLPDEALRAETRLFTHLNRGLLLTSLCGVGLYATLRQAKLLPPFLSNFVAFNEEMLLWLMLFLVLLPLALTMALTWKTKEVILTSVFGSNH
jgi:hypothetical protein